MEKDGYAWWKDRSGARWVSTIMYDLIISEGLKGFGKCLQASNRREWRWLGPESAFFEALQEEFGDLPFIAEDLGYITPEVRI